MKRKRGWPSPHFPPTSVRRAFTPGQLAETGAVILAWNHLEAVLDMVLFEAMRLPDFYRHEVVGRIHGIDGKIALIRIAATHVHLVLQPRTIKLIENTLSAIGECKSLRDAVAHAHVTSREWSEIVETKGARGQSFDLLFSQKTLAALANRIDVVSLEIREMVHLYSFQASIMAMGDDNLNGRNDQDIQSLRPDVRRYIARLARRQKRRLSLRPLPTFPKELPTRPVLAGGNGVQS